MKKIVNVYWIVRNRIISLYLFLLNLVCKGLKYLCLKAEKKYSLRSRKQKTYKNIYKLKGRKKLSKKQQRDILAFYKRLVGQRVSLHSHEYFYSRTGVFSLNYIPGNFYHVELVPRANISSYNVLGDDKNLDDLLFPGENIVHSILKNMNGYYYYKGRPVFETEAISLCQNMDYVIIKPSVASKGRGVQLFTVKDGITDINGLTIEQLFKQYKSNFIIQERVVQHKDMAALNSTSLNTIRVLSYRSGMEVLIIYSVVRIGRQGQIIDNQCAGGISTSVSKEGTLGEFAYGGYTEDNIVYTDSGVELKGYQLPSYDKVLEMVKRLHLKLPYFNIVGWDVAIQENGEPILIEFNTNPGLSQSAFKSGLGEYTERIIRELWPRRNTRFPV